MNSKATAEQKRFHQWCRDQGCIINGSSEPALHHIKGGKMKLKGVKNAGEWFVLPVCYWWHQDGSNPNAIHTNRKSFVTCLGATEKQWWELLMGNYFVEFGHYPMSEEEYQIIAVRA